MGPSIRCQMQLANQTKSKNQPRHRKGTVRPEPITDIESVLEGGASVGEEIRQLRKASSLTLGQLAEASDLSKGYLSVVDLTYGLDNRRWTLHISAYGGGASPVRQRLPG